MCAVVTGRRWTLNNEVASLPVQVESVRLTLVVLRSVQEPVRTGVHGADDAIGGIEHPVAGADLCPRLGGSVEAVQERASCAVHGNRIKEVASARDVCPIVDRVGEGCCTGSDDGLVREANLHPVLALVRDPKGAGLVDVTDVVGACLNG
jgi:hypothetical protein